MTMQQATHFPVSMLPEITHAPEHYRLLTRVPFTRNDAQFPMTLHPPQTSLPEDEMVNVVILDLETTGLSYAKEEIIEFGAVKCVVHAPTGKIMSIQTHQSYLREPLNTTISEFITQLTHIDNEMVAGHSITPEMLAPWFEDDPIVFSHNAQFDRNFFDRAFPQFQHLRWGCTIKDINWKSAGFDSTKLGYLLKDSGYFMDDAHRADIDALGLTWLMHIHPQLFKSALANVETDSYTISAIGAPYDVKDTLKSAKFRFNGKQKHWYINIPSQDKAPILAFLDDLYPNAKELVSCQAYNARTRYYTPD